MKKRLCDLESGEWCALNVMRLRKLRESNYSGLILCEEEFSGD